jgi:shikimate kinase
VILIGFPGSGKTTCGELVALELGLPFIDTDREIEKAFQKMIGKTFNCREITHQFGSSFFRNLEEKILLELPVHNAYVLALGGGTLLSTTNQRILGKLSPFVHLKVSKTTLAERLLNRTPLPTYLDPDDPYASLETLYNTRSPLYEQFAQITIDTAGLSITDIVQQLRKVQHG